MIVSAIDREISIPLLRQLLYKGEINSAKSNHYFQLKRRKRDSSESFKSSDSVDCCALHSPTRWHFIYDVLLLDSLQVSILLQPSRSK